MVTVLRRRILSQSTILASILNETRTTGGNMRVSGRVAYVPQVCMRRLFVCFKCNWKGTNGYSIETHSRRERRSATVTADKIFP